MGLCRFKTSEVKRLIEHAKAATQFDMGYESDKTPAPGLLFVHDQGVYLMSNGIPRFSNDNPNQPDVNSHVAYAEGCDPNVGEFDDWYGLSRELVGGDDFVEVLPISDDWLAHCDIFATFELDVSDTAISTRFTDLKSRPAAQQPTDVPAVNVFDQSIAALKLGGRARKCLGKLGVTTLAQLIRMRPDDLMECYGFGVTSLNQIRTELAKLNLTLQDDTKHAATTAN